MSDSCRCKDSTVIHTVNRSKLTLCRLSMDDTAITD